MDRIDAAQGAGGQVFGPSDEGAATAATGTYRGQEVAVLEDPNSLLQDAAEELTFGASEHVEKKVGERKLKSEIHAVKVQHSEEAGLRTGKLKDLDPEQIKRFLEQLKKGGADAGSVRDLAQKTFRDPSQRHSALAAAFEELGGDAGFADLREAVGTVRVELEAAEGPQIQAGYNIDGVDCSAVGTAQEARDLYRGTILGKADVAAAFTTLMEKYGPDGFAESLKFLMKATGADLACAAPSTEKEYLHTANSDLYQVEVLGNLYRDAEKMLEQVERFDREGGGRGRDQGGSEEEAEDQKKGQDNREGKGPGKAEDGLCALGLMKEILRLKDIRVVDPGGIRSFLKLKGDVAPTRDVVLTKGFKDLVYRLPLKVYNDAANRQNVLNGIQVVLDEVIAVEEAALAEEEEKEGEAP